VRPLAWSLFVVLSILCAWPSSRAQAQLTTLREHVRQMDSFKLAVGGDVNTFFGPVKNSGYAFVQPTMLASFRIYEAVLETALPFAYFHEADRPGADHNQFALGNPWFALSFLPDTVCGLSRLSLGIAPNLMHARDPRAQMAHFLAQQATGNWDGYLWLDHSLPLVLGASTRKERGMWRVAWDGDLIFGLPGNGRKGQFGAQTAGEAALLFGWNTSLGARLSATYYPTFAHDQFQSALTSYLRYARVGDAFGVRFTLNLIAPGGFSFDRNGVWGAALFYTKSI
jgi:hypothetical protein